MTWLAVLFAIEAGMVPNNGWYVYEEHRGYEADQPGYYTTLEMEAQAWLFFVGGSLRTDMTTDTYLNYNPHWVTYDFNAGIRWEFLEVGFRHRCTHPIQTYVYNASYLKKPVVEGAYDEVYARATFYWGGDQLGGKR